METSSIFLLCLRRFISHLFGATQRTCQNQIYTMGLSKSNLRVHGFLTFTVIRFSLNSVDAAETSYKPSLEIRTSYTSKVVLIVCGHNKDNKKLCFSTSLVALRVLCESKNIACNYCWFSVSRHSK